jgi:hypothetical protein
MLEGRIRIRKRQTRRPAWREMDGIRMPMAAINSNTPESRLDVKRLAMEVEM